MKVEIQLTVTAVPAPVPEPATWALLATGFGMIGAIMRRRRAVDGLASFQAG